MMGRSLFFTAPHRVEVREETVRPPLAGEVWVECIASAISPGTEMLVYRGQAPTELAVDETISALPGSFGFPLKYGYAAVGRVSQLGSNVDASWLNRLVFAFNPHESHFVANVANLLPVPAEVDPDTALFLPNMETAVNFLHDGAPLVGEHVAVFGQGIVGLLTTALLARIPLNSLTTFDHYSLRRETSRRLGAHASLDPSKPVDLQTDLTYELSGSPAALDQAIAATGFDGRVIIGSWYGQKRADLNLGGRFHRSRIRLISSQVSTLAPELSGRWTKARRLEVAWQMLREVKPAHLITHRFPFDEAAKAYELIDQHPDTCIQVILSYQ
ncbi:MAG: zinc-binding alcohol dehydrogenase [Chloroflexi bacterium]|nr:zinc-binding alcohol dehydrogenase [Chloroflexota bacterium]